MIKFVTQKTNGQRGSELLAIYRDTDTRTWRVAYGYMTWTGDYKQSTERGFVTKRESLAWEHEQAQKAALPISIPPWPTQHGQHKAGERNVETV